MRRWWWLARSALRAVRRLLPTRARSSPRVKRSIRDVAHVERALWAGYVSAASERLEVLAGTDQVPRPARINALMALTRWHLVNDHTNRARATITQAVDLAGSAHTSYGLVMLHADVLLAAGEHAQATTVLESSDPSRSPTRLRLSNALAVNNPTRHDNQRLDLLNAVLRGGRMEPLSLLDPTQSLTIDNLTVDPALLRPVEGPLVSVIVPVRNGESTIATALRSLLAQTWTNLEIIVVDDASEDATARIVKEFVGNDARIRLISHDTNVGTYASRNRALEHVTGAFITTHDADDWSHPRKIEIQAQPLVDDEALSATRSSQVRVNDAMVFQVPTGRPRTSWIIPNMSSLLVRREVFDTIGHWDNVRIAADGEFLRRLWAHGGKERTADLASGVPVHLSRTHDTSLTASAATGHLSMHHVLGVRRLYREASEYWHRSQRFPDSLPYIPSAGAPRPFPVPIDIDTSEAGPPREVEAIVVGDFSAPPGGDRRAVDAVHGAVQDGRSVALIHVPSLDTLAQGPKAAAMDDALWDLSAEGAVELSLADNVVGSTAVFVRELEGVDRLPHMLHRCGVSRIVMLVDRGSTRGRESESMSRPAEDVARDFQVIELISDKPNSAPSLVQILDDVHET